MEEEIEYTSKSTKQYYDSVTYQDLEAKNKNSSAEELINAYEDYINLLGDELDGVCVLLHVRGWESSRVEQGKQCRIRIQTAKKNLRNADGIIEQK